MPDTQEPHLMTTIPPKTGDTINGYTLEEPLKTNSQCWVFVCHHCTDPSVKRVAKIAVKAEYKKLLNEIQCYKLLGTGRGVPQLYYYKCWTEEGEVWLEISMAMIVIEKFVNVFSKTCRVISDQTLTLEQLIPIAVQQIDCLQYIHSKGLTHRGVKPDNFVVSEDSTQVFIIDFNKSKRYLDGNGQHIPYRRSESKRPKGLPYFHSINYHNGIRRSRRDDMESLAYCWVYLFKGSLPWSSVKRYPNQWKNYVKAIGKCVRETSIEDICDGLPKNFLRYLQMCREMDFYAEPDYEVMRQLIAQSIDEINNN